MSENEQSQGLKALISLAQIQEIRLVEASAVSTLPSSRETAITVNMRINTTASVKEKRDDGNFSVLAIVETRLFDRHSDSPQSETTTQHDGVASVRARFELRYKLPETFVAESKDLEEFARTNALFNAWPYFREFVQNTFSRMSVPAIVLPLLRIGQQQSPQVAR